MPSPADTLLTKTDAELQLLATNPHTPPEQVAAAQRELARRAASPATAPASPAPAPSNPAAAPASPEAMRASPAMPPVYATPAPFGPPPVISPPASYFDEHQPEPPAPDYAAEYLDEPTRRRPWLVPVLVLLATLAAGVGLYSWSVASKKTAAAVAAREAARLSPAALKLETVATNPIPTYDVPALVADQVAKLPAAEKQDAQPLRQFRELSRRFWEAETQSEYLTEQARTGQAGPAFANQALLARETWRAWNKGAMYGYKFGPAMQGQYALMGKVASAQQHILARLPELLPGRKFLADRELKSRGADVEAWMAGIRPTSPVTGQPYKVTVLEIKY